ncbi:uncharacterized protein LOC128307507 [Anopheles moucheti]|uniref:uncharacterized protein LOC128307507 n=1 Tax=Anopheles moucheti TaxID=186751 RepID=UPI0022F079CB|nr:uncharacterized protein LOC128307507 [Anopheles moucheti]
MTLSALTSDLLMRLELIDQCKEDFVTIMNKLEEEKEELVDDENHIQERASFFKRYCVVKGFLLHQSVKEIVPTANSTFNSSSGSASFGGPMQLRLPKIELPSFNGEATKWLTFKDRFISMIHSAAEIPAVMKLQYLLASLVGEAATHFEHTEVIADNYAVTWDALLKRYDDKKALVREYYRALHFLPRMETHHVDDLARLVDDFTRHVKGLRKLGEPIDHWDTPLTNLLFLKMDKLSIVAWEELGSERDGYGELVKFLEERVRMLKSSKLLEQPATDNVVKVAGTKVAGTKSSDGIATDPLDCIRKRFWELETINDGINPTVEDAMEHHYTNTTTRDSSGRYIVALPWTNDQSIVLGESKPIADRRLYGMERRWEHNPTLKTAYLSFMEEYLQLGHMRKLEEPIDDNVSHCYIPHHAVFKESSTSTKIRVVFDASCKTSSGFALNDALMVGPVIQDDLFSILLRFRSRRIAFTGDIEKMYRQILHDNNDKRFLRIRFRKNRNEPIATYELQTVTYGTASAPYLATRTLQQTAKDMGDRFPSAVDPVLNDFYVDDLLSGADDVTLAKAKVVQIYQMLDSAGMKIRKWASNSLDVLSDIPICDKAIQDTHELQDSSVSTLGLIWDTGSDTLRFKVQIPDPEPNLTKRMILSYIARTFDPLGLLGPTILVAKLFMQRLWALNHNGNECKWDTVLPPLLQEEWREFHSDLHLLNNIQVPRFIAQPHSNIQLHMFADASKSAWVITHPVAHVEAGLRVYEFHLSYSVDSFFSRIAAVEIVVYVGRTFNRGCSDRICLRMFVGITFA